LVVKTALLRQTGNTDFTHVSLVPHTVGDFLPRQNGGSATTDICNMTSSLAQANLREGFEMTEEAELVSIFVSFIEKLEANAPVIRSEHGTSPTKPFLAKVATRTYFLVQ
jgi:hypothetical protein